MNKRTQRAMALVLVCTLVVGHAVRGMAQKSGQQHWRDQQRLGAVGMILAVNESTGQWSPYGTGVFVDVDTSFAHSFFVTNRHVGLGRDSLLIRYRTYKQQDSLLTFSEREIVLHSNRYLLCPTTDDSDFVAFMIRGRSANVPISIRTSNTISFQDLNYGEEVMFYGYPKYSDFGLDESRFSFPIVRGGNIAYFALDDVYLGDEKIMIPGMFLIDGVSYGGGSGSPVFVKRLQINAKLKLVYDQRFAGIVRGHYPVTKQIRVPLSQIPLISVAIDSLHPIMDSLFLSKIMNDFVFYSQENSGLAFVISSDLIFDFIRKAYPKWLSEQHAN